MLITPVYLSYAVFCDPLSCIQSKFEVFLLYNPAISDFQSFLKVFYLEHIRDPPGPHFHLVQCPTSRTNEHTVHRAETGPVSHCTNLQVS